MQKSIYLKVEGKVELQGVKSVSKLRKQCTNGKEWRTGITEIVQKSARRESSEYGRGKDGNCI